MVHLPSCHASGNDAHDRSAHRWEHLMNDTPGDTVQSVMGALLLYFNVCRASTTLSARDNHLGRISGR
jgi:hypothetical protein